MDNNWRSMLTQDSRQKIVERIMDTLQKYMAITGQDGMSELLKIAWRFEEKIFQTASDQQDYLIKISVKMLSLETKSSQGNLAATSIWNGMGQSGNAGQSPLMPSVSMAQTNNGPQVLPDSEISPTNPHVAESKTDPRSEISLTNQR